MTILPVRTWKNDVSLAVCWMALIGMIILVVFNGSLTIPVKCIIILALMFTISFVWMINSMYELIMRYLYKA